MPARCNVKAFRGSRPRLDAKRGLAALLLFAALSSATAVGQWTPQPVFTELFAYDPAAPSQLLGNWRISSQLDSTTAGFAIHRQDSLGPQFIKGPASRISLTAT